MELRLWSLRGALSACALAMLGLPGAMPPGAGAHGGGALEERKLPMHFVWHGTGRGGAADQRRENATCKDNCRGLVSAIGVITGETPAEFASFARDHDLTGATIVLDSSGGSVLDAIELGRRWRDLGVTTTVGTVTEARVAGGGRLEIYPDAYCESMCVFLLLSGKTRYVPVGAHVRVHQIWMGDRAEDATTATYSAQDVMIIERDVGRLAKYTFEMGGSGELLGLALSIPPWEPLHELSPSELRKTNLVASDAIAEMTLPVSPQAVQNGKSDKPVQDRFAAPIGGGAGHATKTAEALPSTDGSERP